MNLPEPHNFKYVLVTAMKDEAPYILDWLSYHISIGFTHFVVLTNDCSDGTEKICRNLEKLGILTHMNNKAPHPRGIQKTAWARAKRLKPIQEAEWIMALDVDEYLYLRHGDGHLEDLFQMVKHQPIAISFVWQIFGNDGIEKLIDQPVIAQFRKSSHPLQARPYQIRGLKTIFKSRYFEEIGTHRPHNPNIGTIAGRPWVNADGTPINELLDNPYWCVWNNGFLFGGSLGRVYHYALRSKEAFMLKMIRGFVNRTERGVRSSQSPLSYWQMFDWDVYQPRDKMDLRLEAANLVKSEFLSQDKIARLHSQGFAHHQQKLVKIMQDYPDFREEFEKIVNIAPKTTLEADDPALQDGNPGPVTFSSNTLMESANKSLINQVFIQDYYAQLTNS